MKPFQNEPEQSPAEQGPAVTGGDLPENAEKTAADEIFEAAEVTESTETVEAAESTEVPAGTEISDNLQLEENSTIFTKSPTTTPEKKPVSGKKKRRNLFLILIAAVVVLAGGVFALVQFLPDLNKKDEAETLPSIQVKTVQADQLKQITVHTDKKTDLVFTAKEAEKTSASSSEEIATLVWSLQGYDPTLIADSSINSIASAVASFEATRKMTDETLNYGLDSPAVTVEVAMQNAAENYSIYFGNESPDKSGRYAKVSGVEGIYLVSLGTFETINTTPEKLANTVIISAPSMDDAKSSEKKYFNENEGTLQSFDTLTLSGSYYPNAITLSVTDNDMAKFRITAGKKVRYANEERVQAMMGVLTNGLVAIDTYKLAPTAADLEKYGLNNPDVVFSLSYAKNTVSFRAKLYDKEKNYYAVVINGRNAIYAVTAEALDMLQYREADFYHEYVFLEYLNGFSKAEIQTKNQSYQFDIAYDTAKEEFNITSNGAKIDDSLFSAYYQYLLTLSPVENSDPAESTPAYTATFTYKNSTKQQQIKLYKQSDRRYLLEINGEKYGVVSATLYENLTTYIQYVIDGKGIPDAV